MKEWLVVSGVAVGLVCVLLGFGRVVKEPEKDGRVRVRLGLLNEPVSEDSARLLSMDDGSSDAE